MPKPLEYQADMNILIEDPRTADITSLLDEHMADMISISPPGSVHALDLSGLTHPSVTFWAARSDGQLMGCGALKDLGDGHGEIKSMRTATAHRRRRVAANLLTHIIEHARNRGFERLSLETGSYPVFEPARLMYAQVGFVVCDPFADYQPDPHSTFMTLALR